jgi:hypothetical protein
VTSVSGDFDTETNFDLLYYQYSASGTAAYTGSGTISDSSNRYTAFRWHSNSVSPSVSVSVQLSSPSSSLPSRRSAGSGTSSAPIILLDEERGPAASGKLGSPLAVVGIVIGCFLGVALLVVGAVCLHKWLFREGNVRRRRSLDEPLALDDQSGSGAAQERREALKLIRDKQRS